MMLWHKYWVTAARLASSAYPVLFSTIMNKCCDFPLCGQVVTNAGSISRVWHCPCKTSRLRDKSGGLKESNINQVLSCHVANKTHVVIGWHSQLRFMMSPPCWYSVPLSTSLKCWWCVQGPSWVVGAFKGRWHCSGGWGAGQHHSADFAGCSAPCPSTAHPRSPEPMMARQETAMLQLPSSSSPAPHGLQRQKVISGDRRNFKNVSKLLLGRSVWEPTERSNLRP